MSFMTRDRALALATLGMVAILAVELQGIPGPRRWQSYGSDFFPRLLLWTLGILAILLLLRSFMAGFRNQPEVVPDFWAFMRANPRILALLALFGAYVWAMPQLGFRMATIAYLMVAFGILTGFRSWRTVLICAAVAVVTPLLVHALFQYGLRLRLP